MASQMPPSEEAQAPSSQPWPTSLTARNRSSTTSSSASVPQRLRSNTLRLMEADIPTGVWAAAASQAAQAPSLSDIRRGSLSSGGGYGGPQLEPTPSLRGAEGSDMQTVPRRTSEGQPIASFGRRRRTSSGFSKDGNKTVQKPFVIVKEERTDHSVDGPPPSSAYMNRTETSKDPITNKASPQSRRSLNLPSAPVSRYANGYIPPPKKSWPEATRIALKAFWRWMLTPLGFLITLYGLNVVAWGGMLFLLLCNAAPAMCHPTCDDINSPRRKWIEIDSQILNALFCVTGFGLIPWRFRDLWFLMQYRLGKRTEGLRRLAGINRSWFRLPGSDVLKPEMNEGPDGFSLPDHENPAVPLPVSKIPAPPPTGERAPPTKVWKLDFVVWCNVWNTLFQACLCGFMWGMDWRTRPSWSTGLFIALACGVAGCGGLMIYFEGKRVKKIEGVPMEQAQTIRDEETAVEMARRSQEEARI